ncbi:MULTISPECIES: ATP-binding cassette domain-containing protein [unclassified Streptomyces]|uniref:ATP-binding cassette domain-containing protein n=1 Tax=unclassified Streptomyces TaxID=2593676 RepID=UPI00068C4B17|nr:MULTISPECIES: ABC transporter ATP-binding protein [unclassified Streptomyces]
MTGTRRLLGGLLFAVRTAAACRRRRFAAGTVLVLGAGAAGGLVPLGSQHFADAMFHGQPRQAVWWGLALGGLWTVAMGAANIGALVLHGVRESMRLTVDCAVVHAVCSVPEPQRLESGRAADRLTLLRNERDVVCLAALTPMVAAGVLVQVGVTWMLLATVSPLLGTLPVLAVGAFVVSARVQRTAEAAEEVMAADERSAAFLYELATRPAHGGELRLSGMPEELLRRHTRLWRGVTRGRIRAELHASLVAGSALLLGLGAFFAVVLVAADRARRGTLGIGELLLILTAGQQLYWQIGRAVSISSDLLRVARSATRYRWLVEQARPTAADVPGTASPVGRELPGRLPAGRRTRVPGLRLENVSFTYPGAGTPALSEVTLDLPAGKVVAVVGANGSGKSTLVRLVCRYCTPSRGSVLLTLPDGGTSDLARVPLDDWSATTTGAFQDFLRLEGLLSESIGAGEPSRISDEAAVRQALLRSGDGALEHRWPDGLRTLLGTSFHDGVVPSTGQWQRIAVGRATMRRQPWLVVLDEPTASLDPHVEDGVYRAYARMTRAGGESGAAPTTVLVSHRFSTVRTADVIVVMDRGRVAEYGSHEELLDAGGLYARTYRTQARGYR